MKNLIFVILMVLFVLNGFSQTQFIAHRGASYLAPENTVSSAKLAWELGTDAVEIDVHLSKDGKVMVNHDANTQKTSGDDYEIKDTDSDVLRQLDVGRWKADKYKGERIPFVEEIIATIPPEKTLVIEIKCGSEVLPALKDAIEQSGKIDQITFISFGWQTIVDTRKAFPENPCYWLSEDIEDVYKKLVEVAHYGLNGINLYHQIIDSELMQKARAEKLDVLTWTVDDPDEAKRLIELGVAGITTNRPAWLKEQLQ